MGNKAMKELIEYMVDVRKTFKLFTLNEAAASCGVTEMTVRNFENGKTVNPVVFMYYIAVVDDAYTRGHLRYGQGATAEEAENLQATEPQEYTLYRCKYSIGTFRHYLTAVMMKED